MFGLMFGMVEGNVPPAETPVQQQIQFTAAIQAQRMLGTVDEVQAKLQVQEQTMLKAEGELPEPTQEAFKFMNGYLNQVRQDIEELIPLQFRANQPEKDGEGLPGQYGPGPNECEDEVCEPAGDQHRYGQEDENDGQHGPGPNECEQDCEPSGDENHYGQDEDNDGQNGPGEGDDDCEPVGDQNQNGKTAE
jgi:hypothetical protein